MGKEYSAEITGKKDLVRWNCLLEQSLYPSYLQTMAYEYSKQVNRRSISSFIFTKEGEDVAGVHYSIKHSKYNLLSTADILSGIVFKEKPNEKLLRFIVQHFCEFAQGESAAFIRLTPWLPMNIGEQKTNYEGLFSKVFTNLGFSIIKKGRHTYWIDLNKSEEELFKRMKPQVRRKIRKAINAGLELETYNTFSVEQVDVFYQLYKDLGNNKNFTVLSKSNFFSEVKSLMDEGAVLFFLKYKSKIVDVALTSDIGMATYYHGAVNPDYKKLEGCPSPGHYMQWVMIKYMKNKGLKKYDMAYCPGPVPQTDHPNYGIWRFKYDFGGDHVEYLPTYGKAIRPFTGRLFKALKYRK